MRMVTAIVCGGLLFLGLGCARVDGGGEAAELVITSDPQRFDDGRDHVIVDSPRPSNLLWHGQHTDELAPVVPTAVEDPCDCDSEACVDRWVADNLGCNVCVVLYCNGENSMHLCADCDGEDIDGPNLPH